MAKEVVEETKENQHNSNEVYEEMLQKTEKEIRTHFRIEQQLKLHIDNLQQQIEDFERKIIPKEAAQAKETIDQLKKENAQLKSQTQEIVKEKSKKSEQSSESTEKNGTRTLKTNEFENSLQKEFRKLTAEEEISRLRNQLEEKEKECCKLKQNNSTLNLHLKQLTYPKEIQKN